ncbi:MAG: hypothetical protein M3O02_01235 [Acidobacteriota bacterium]|nr:hypothetical protein [Acidobacteriota bacterium]
MGDPTHTPGGLAEFSDEDFRRVIWGALRLVAVAVLVGVPLLAWKLGWASAGLYAVGAVISGSGLFEWLRLMSALMSRMEAGTPERPVVVKPLAPVLIGFFLRLGGAVVLLYGSLKLLHGSIYALAAGLVLGVFALLFQALRLVKSWTV